MEATDVLRASQRRVRSRPMTDGTLPVGHVGLTDAEARTLLAAEGPNRLPAARRPPTIWRFAKELVHFFALMLWVAALLAWIAGLLALTVAIAAVVVVNALFAFIQERRADQAADRLRVLLPTRVTVRREGQRRRVDAAERGTRVTCWCSRQVIVSRPMPRRSRATA